MNRISEVSVVSDFPLFTATALAYVLAGVNHFSMCNGFSLTSLITLTALGAGMTPSFEARLALALRRVDQLAERLFLSPQEVINRAVEETQVDRHQLEHRLAVRSIATARARYWLELNDGENNGPDDASPSD